MSSFDVWVMRFDAGTVPPADRVAHAFGLDDTSARALVTNLPRVVKHGVAARQAGEMRRVLESIGAEVECRPAGRPKGATNPRGAALPNVGTDPRGAASPKPGTNPKAAVFQKPNDAGFADRVSAIDPFAPAGTAGVPRISVDDPSASDAPGTQSEISGVVRPPSASPPRSGLPPRSVDDAIRARALARQRKVFVRRALGTVVAGLLVGAIGVITNNSVFLGNANVFGVAVDGLAIFLTGSGAADLYTTLRS